MRVLLALLTAALLLAQGPIDFRASVDLKLVPCTVVDARGNTVRDLQPSEFRLFENGMPQQIRQVWTDRDLPATVGVLVDFSTSQRSLASDHMNTAMQFFARFLRTGDRGFLVSINYDVVVRSELLGGDFGPRRRLIPAEGELMGQPCPRFHDRPLCGGSPLWTAVYLSAEKMLKYPGNRAIVLLSDGIDTGGRRSLDDTIERAQMCGAAVYTIQYASGGTPAAVRELSRLSQETGGLMFSPQQTTYDAIFTRIEQDVRSRYVIGYRPSNNNGRHEVTVEVTRPGLKVRVQ